MPVLFLQRIFDGRGACPFIRSFHYGGVVGAAVATALLFAILTERFPRLRYRAGRATVIYLGLFYCTWAVAMALAEATARWIERRTHTREQVGDVGYGWFYWSDSGMGAEPTTILSLFVVTFFRPWLFLPLPAFVYVIFVLMAHRSLESRTV